MDNDFDHSINDDSLMSNETQRGATNDDLTSEPVVVRPSMLPLVCYT